MDGPKITVYLPTVEYRRACAEDGSRVFLGWYVPNLQAIVAAASYDSSQKSDLARELRELGKLPELQYLFHRHGNLLLLEGFSLEGDDEGYVLRREGGKPTYVQVVTYAVEDFAVVSFDELCNLGSTNKQPRNGTSMDVPEKMRISSYLITGCALTQYINEQLVTKPAGSQECGENGTINRRPNRRKASRIGSLETMVYMWIVHLGLHISHCARAMVSGASIMHSNILKSWLHKLALVSVLCNRVMEVAQWQDVYDRLQRHTDIVEYVSVRHRVRQSVISFLLDVFMGVVQFFVFRRTVVYYVNKLRLVLRTLYVSSLKYMTYQFTMRIGKYCKVNNEIAVFLSRLLMSKIIVWRVMKPQIREYFFIASKVFQFSAMLGLTCQIAVLADIMTIETLHIAYAHSILLYITKWTQHYLYSLLQLFKGKKWNELKQSLDSNDYTREQLFLGTVIFTLLLLIYPTIWIFYCVTLVVYLPIVVVKAIMKGIIEVITKIPSYYMVYNVIFPNRFKDHIYFDYDGEICGRDVKVGKGNPKDGDKQPKNGIRPVPPCRNLEVRCGQFSARNVLQPVMSGLKVCARASYLGGII